MPGTQKARYTSQMPFVGTPTQEEAITDLATREGVSKATVVRWAVNQYFGLTDEGERPNAAQAAYDAGGPFREQIDAAVAGPVEMHPRRTRSSEA